MGAFRRPLGRGIAAIAAVSGIALLSGVSAVTPAAAKLSSGTAASGAPGSRLWASFYTGPGTGNDTAMSVAVARAGSAVFVTGQSPGSASGADYVTIAYDAATGSQLWLSRYNGPANGSDIPSALAVS